MRVGGRAFLNAQKVITKIGFAMITLSKEEFEQGEQKGEIFKSGVYAADFFRKVPIGNLVIVIFMYNFIVAGV